MGGATAELPVARSVAELAGAELAEATAVVCTAARTEVEIVEVGMRVGVPAVSKAADE